MENAIHVRLVQDGLFQGLVMAMRMASGMKFGTTRIRKLVCAIRIGQVEG